MHFNNNYCIPVADVSRLSVVAKNNADTIILERNPENKRYLGVEIGIRGCFKTHISLHFGL